MTPEQADRAMEAESSRSGEATDACADWCRAEIKGFVVPLPPWGEAEEVPGSKDNPADQYRYWLWEWDCPDSPENRKAFADVLYESQMERWEDGKTVEWWHEASDNKDEPRERD